jgi:hypothetical protein
MLAAIEFDNMPCIRATEVDNETIEWHLPPKLPSS